MAPEDIEKSLSDEATFAGGVGSRQSAGDQSIGDGQTLGGDDGSGFAAVVDDIEVVDLEARYTIEGTLGQGGMGAVLLATDTRLGRKVAIKRILGEAARSKTATKRFLTEAKAIAALNHANIVQIYDYGQAKDGPFLIMEYVDGGSLAERCKAAALPLEEAVDLACQLCNGLSKAHDAGIIHRDIKPANVLLSADGVPKLTDFGLAKAEASDHGMTMTGSVMGTPDFMPPEQRRDASLVDHRSDLWSLAASIYQMVTGRSPKIIRFNDVPAALQNILARALEEEKDARYQSAREFRDALRQSLLASDGDVRDLGDGECSNCGAFNEVSRRFCRECAESLEVPCLACESPMKAWESVCGQCGARQAEHLETLRASLLEKRTQAEGLVSDGDFSQAEHVAVEVGELAGGRFRDLAKWSAAFVEGLPSARDAAITQAVAQMDEARKHEEAYDYASAVASLEDIPEKLRQEVLPGCSEAVSEALARVHEKQTKTEQLYPVVREKVAAGVVDGLLDDAEQLLELRPDRKDLQKLVKQLRERREKLTAKRDDYLARAQQLYDGRRYADAVKLLEAVSSDVVNPTVTEMIHRARDRAERVVFLHDRLRSAAQAAEFDGILPLVEELLEIGPQHQSVTDFREKAVAYEAKQAAERRRKMFYTLTAPLATLAVAVFVGYGVRHLPPIPTSGSIGPGATTVPSAMDPPTQAATPPRSPVAAGGSQQRNPASSVPTAVSASPKTNATSASRAAQSPPLAVAPFDAGEAAAHQQAWASHMGTPVEIENSLGMKFVAIPAGTFSMGSADGGKDEQPVHEVTITKPYYLGVTEVTNGQWDTVMGYVPSQWKDANRPVESLTWDEAVAFCEALSALPAERQAGRAYRLPTEAEWEYACRAGATTPYSFGEDASLLGGFAWYADNSGDQTHPVGQKRPNGWGLYGMHGNVWEWCSDRSGDYAAGAVRDPVGPATGSNRVLRGGSWYRTAGDCRSAFRYWINPSNRRSSNGGFRLALSPPGASSPEAVTASEGETSTTADEVSAEPQASTAGKAPRLAVAPFDADEAAAHQQAWASHMGTPVEIENSLGMKFVVIPAGTFSMGSADGEKDEQPVHEVTITRPYYLGVYEVTNGQWLAVMGDVPSEWKDAALPVESVTWDEAVAFCEALSALPAERQAGRVYRLPTEAEWEYACRAGTTTEYSFGDDDSLLGDFAWFGDTRDMTHRGGQKRPNAFGLYDMHGNVWEWCSDWHGDYAAGAVRDPVGPASGSYRVLRGGGWRSTDRRCRSAIRSRSHLSHPHSGFRLALSPSGASSPEASE